MLADGNITTVGPHDSILYLHAALGYTDAYVMIDKVVLTRSKRPCRQGIAVVKQICVLLDSNTLSVPNASVALNSCSNQASLVRHVFFQSIMKGVVVICKEVFTSVVRSGGTTMFHWIGVGRTKVWLRRHHQRCKSRMWFHRSEVPNLDEFCLRSTGNCLLSWRIEDVHGRACIAKLSRAGCALKSGHYSCGSGCDDQALCGRPWVSSSIDDCGWYEVIFTINQAAVMFASAFTTSWTQ